MRLILLPLRIIGSLTICGLVILCLYLGYRVYRYEQAQPAAYACKIWDKAELDAVLAAHQITPDKSYISCNTYYIELSNFAVEGLKPLESAFMSEIDFQFLIDNETEVIAGSFNKNHEIVYQVSKK